MDVQKEREALYKPCDRITFCFGYEDGIVLGNLSKRSRLIISNEYGYLGYYWGYKSFRPGAINSIQDLNDLKSRAIEYGAKMDWDTYQWVLNNFDTLLEPSSTSGCPDEP